MLPTPKRPSPAMVVAIVALVMATTGTAVAAVSFADNAGAVDGKSAVASGATTKQATGRLVATQKSGPGAGRIASKYLDLSGYARGATSTFGKSAQVADNQTLAPETVGSVPGLGTLTSSCVDQNPNPAVEDPSTTLVFANQSGDAVNIARTVGGGNPLVAGLVNGTTTTFTISGSSTFELHVERRGVNYLVEGVVRQDGRGSDNASCLVYGFALATACLPRLHAAATWRRAVVPDRDRARADPGRAHRPDRLLDARPRRPAHAAPPPRRRRARAVRAPERPRARGLGVYAVAGSGSGRTMTVSATLMTSSTARSALDACSRIASGLEAW